MPENREGLTKEEGIIKPWGDPDLHESDINPHEAQRQRKKLKQAPKVEIKIPSKKPGVLDYINHRQD